MKRGGYVSLFQKKLPTLLREWVTSGYLANNIARFIAAFATWVRNSAQNCQSLVRLRDLLTCLGTCPYHYSFAPEIGGLIEEANISPSVHNFTIGVVNQQRGEPYGFGRCPKCRRKWQTSLMKMRDSQGRPVCPKCLKVLKAVKVKP